MKAPKFITITIVSIVLTTTLNAQEYDFSSQRLNGLEVGNFYTEEQFVGNQKISLTLKAYQTRNRCGS